MSDDLSAHLGIAPAELRRRVDRHTLAVQSWLASRSPDAARFSTSAIRASSTGLAVPLLNLALGADFPPETDATLIDNEIEAVKSFFRERQVPAWFWWIGASAQPPNIAQYLEAHHLIFDRPPLPAMVAPLPGKLAPELPHDVEIWQATTAADLAAASQIRRTAFRFPESAALTYFDDMPESWLHTPTVQLYLAGKSRAEPAAMGALIVDDELGLPGVYVMATLPQAQRLGLGKTILARIMSDAAADGHALLILTASRMGYPLYQQFGFVPVFDYALYRPTD